MPCSRQKTIVLSHEAKTHFLELTPGNNSAGLERIINNSSTSIDIDLLAIERTINPNHGPPCEYDHTKTDFSLCSAGEDKFAHIYISTNILMQRYVVFFIEKQMAHIAHIDDLMKRLENTIDLLQKTNDHFPEGDGYTFQVCFFIQYAGDSMRIPGGWQYRMDEAIKAKFGYIQKPSMILPLAQNVKDLTITTESNTLKFTFSHGVN